MTTETIGIPYGSGSARALRWLVGLLLAMMVTLGLFWTMHYLISTADRSLEEARRGHVVDFVRVKREEIVQRRKLKPEKPPAPAVPPPEPPAPELEDIRPRADKISIGTVPVATDIRLSAGGFSLGFGEGDFLPIVKVAPIYPRRALTRGIEGHVILEFTVTRVGTVKDVKVVESVPDSKIFHKAAIEAALKFKYKPRIIDGQPVEVPGVRNKFTFRIEN